MRKLDPRLEQWLQVYNELIEELEKQGIEQTPQSARDGLASLTAKLVTDKVTVGCIQDDFITSEEVSIPIRIYQPLKGSILPVLVYFHGGGHMSGSIEVYDLICRKLAVTTQHLLISVDYRLAPEFPYPHGINDALVVVKKVFTRLDELEISYQRQLSIGGDSGGGAMTASLSHILQHDPEVNVQRQVLIYPSLDYTMQHKSIDQNGYGYLLHKEKISWFFDHYLQHDENRKQVSPLWMKYSTALPETLVITAEFCPLRDEGFEYVERLKQSSVKVRHLHFDDMIHAFMNMEDLVPEQNQELYSEIGFFLNG